MRKPNYSMERKDRERAKEAKAMARVEKRAAKSDKSSQSDGPTTGDQPSPGEAEGQK
ncbi:hypothetical protein [Roseococcus suduntuyensis]|nr:hypothetical protein [Roseococcus suduntuyensis]